MNLELNMDEAEWVYAGLDALVDTLNSALKYDQGDDGMYDRLRQQVVDVKAIMEKVAAAMKDSKWGTK